MVLGATLPTLVRVIDSDRYRERIEVKVKTKRSKKEAERSIREVKEVKEVKK